jgi:hypothetical protein
MLPSRDLMYLALDCAGVHEFASCVKGGDVQLDELRLNEFLDCLNPYGLIKLQKSRESAGHDDVSGADVAKVLGDFHSIDDPPLGKRPVDAAQKVIKRLLLTAGNSDRCDHLPVDESLTVGGKQISIAEGFQKLKAYQIVGLALWEPR